VKPLQGYAPCGQSQHLCRLVRCRRPNNALELTGKKLALFPSRSPRALGVEGMAMSEHTAEMYRSLISIAVEGR
jgi:hypothetical protein